MVSQGLQMVSPGFEMAKHEVFTAPQAGIDTKFPVVFKKWYQEFPAPSFAIPNFAHTLTTTCAPAELRGTPHCR